MKLRATAFVTDYYNLLGHCFAAISDYDNTIKYYKISMKAVKKPGNAAYDHLAILIHSALRKTFT